MTLDLLRRDGDTRAVVKPALGLELARVRAPKCAHAVHGPDRDHDRLLRRDDNVIGCLPICEYQRRPERKDVVVHGLRGLSVVQRTAGDRTHHASSIRHRGVQTQCLVHDGVEHRQPMRELLECRVGRWERCAQFIAQPRLQLRAPTQLD
jgi:hypothetical protein